MADFCKQCSESIFGEDFKDFADLQTERYEAAEVICEGCGPTITNQDGVCIHTSCLERHGNV